MLPGLVTNVQVSLSVDPVRLDPLQVTVERRELALEVAGFYERQSRGFGRFIDREYIEIRAPHKMTDTFMAIPGVTIETSPGGLDLWVVVRSGRVGMHRPPAGARIPVSPSDKAQPPDEYFYPRVVIDGILFHQGGEEPAGIDLITSWIRGSWRESRSTHRRRDCLPGIPQWDRTVASFSSGLVSDSFHPGHLRRLGRAALSSGARRMRRGHEDEPALSRRLRLLVS